MESHLHHFPRVFLTHYAHSNCISDTVSILIIALNHMRALYVKAYCKFRSLLGLNGDKESALKDILLWSFIYNYIVDKVIGIACMILELFIGVLLSFLPMYTYSHHIPLFVAPHGSFLLFRIEHSNVFYCFCSPQDAFSPLLEG